jgi:hypothetical protein
VRGEDFNVSSLMSAQKMMDKTTRFAGNAEVLIISTKENA